MSINNVAANVLRRLIYVLSKLRNVHLLFLLTILYLLLEVDDRFDVLATPAHGRLEVQLEEYTYHHSHDEQQYRHYSCHRIGHMTRVIHDRYGGVHVIALGSIGSTTDNVQQWSDRDGRGDLDPEWKLRRDSVAGNEIHSLLGGDICRWVDLGETGQVGELKCDDEMSTIFTSQL